MALVMMAALLCAAFLPAAYADTVGSVTVHIPADGTTYRLYRVGGYEDGEVKMDEAYADVDLTDLVAAASAIAHRVEGQQPMASGAVSGGKYTFTGVAYGIYLLCGDDFSSGGVDYHPIPAIVSVPTNTDGNLNWNVSITGKYDTNDLLSISVLKIWKGDSETVRPKTVTVQLQMNGENYGEPVVLSKDNNWRYTWNDLPSTEVWYVKEVQIPQYYKANTTRVENTFVIENSRLVPPPTVPPRIPQTGQLWWPVYSMVCVGMAFIALGLIRRRKSEEDA